MTKAIQKKPDSEFPYVIAVIAMAVISLVVLCHKPAPGHKAVRFAAAQCTLAHGTMTVDHLCISNDAIIGGRICNVIAGITCLMEIDRNGVVYNYTSWPVVSK